MTFDFRDNILHWAGGDGKTGQQVSVPGESANTGDNGVNPGPIKSNFIDNSYIAGVLTAGNRAIFTEKNPNSQLHQSGNTLNGGAPIGAGGTALNLVANEIFSLDPVAAQPANTAKVGVRRLREAPGSNLSDVTDSADLAHLRIATQQGGLIDSQGILQAGVLSPRLDPIPPFAGWGTQTRWRDRSWAVSQGHSDPPRALARQVIAYTPIELAEIADNGFPDLSGPRGSQPDADGDGMSDDWETSEDVGDDGDFDPKENTKTGSDTGNGPPPNSAHIDFHPWADPDGDGWTNLEEFLNDTDPNIGNDPMKTEFDLFP